MTRKNSILARKWQLGGSLLAVMAASLAAEAQAQSSGGLDEIVVTARRRAESLQQTPVAVTALSGEVLEERQVFQIADVGKFAPNVSFDSAANISGSSASVTVFIRGVGQTDFNLTIDPGVGIYVDGVYVSRSVGGLLDTVDLESVQVLRGPQGTLFGKNTIGGAVLVTSKAPSTEEFEVTAEATTGRFNRLDFRGAVNLPISDRFAIRASVSELNRDGYQERIIDGDTQGDQNSLSGRVSALFEATDNLTFNLTFDGTHRRETSAPNTLLRVNNDPNGAGGLGTFGIFYNAVQTGGTCNPPFDPPNNPLCYNNQWVTGDVDTTFENSENRSDLDLWGVNLTTDLSLGAVNVKSITAYRDLESFFNLANDGSPFELNFSSNTYTQSQFSQELQFTGSLFDDRFDWLVGLFYLNEEGTDINTVRFPPFLLVSGGDVDNDSYAAFAQFGFDITDRLSLTLGGRYTDETKRFTPDQILAEDLTGSFPPDVRLLPFEQVTNDISEFTPSVTVDYALTDDIFTYFNYSRGFKSGGFTQRVFPPLPETPEFDPEFVDAFEVGIKTELFDNRLRLNLAGFYSDYDDLQVIVNEGVAPVVRNAGAATLAGFEAEFDTVLFDDLIALNGSVGYLDAEYDEVSPLAAPITEDFELPNAPRWTATVGATVNVWQADAGHRAFIRADYSYRGEHFKDAVNTLDLRQEGFSLLGLSGTFQSPDARWAITAGGTNITGERFLRSGYADIDLPGSGLGSVNGNFSPPAEWFTQVRFRY